MWINISATHFYGRSVHVTENKNVKEFEPFFFFFVEPLPSKDKTFFFFKSTMFLYFS